MVLKLVNHLSVILGRGEGGGVSCAVFNLWMRPKYEQYAITQSPCMSDYASHSCYGLLFLTYY